MCTTAEIPVCIHFLCEHTCWCRGMYLLAGLSAATDSCLTLSKGGKMMGCDEYSGKLMCSSVAFSVYGLVWTVPMGFSISSSSSGERHTQTHVRWKWLCTRRGSLNPSMITLVDNVSIKRVCVYQERKTSSAGWCLRSSAGLCSQTPWCWPTLWGSAGSDGGKKKKMRQQY